MLLLVLLGLVLPWRNAIVVGGVSIGVIVGIGAAAIWSIWKLDIGQIRAPKVSILLICIIYCWMLISSVWAPDLLSNIGNYLTLTMGLLLIIIVWDALRYERHIHWFFFSIILGGIVVISIYFYYYFTEPQYTRAFLYDSLRFFPGGMARRLVYLFPIAWYLFLDSKSKVFRWTALSYILLTPAVVFITGTRQALVVLGIFLLLLFITRGFGNHLDFDTQGTRSRYSITILLGVMIIGIFFAMTFAPSWSISRMLQIPTEILEGDFGNRLHIWKYAIAIWTDNLYHIIIGTGIGGFSYFAPVGEPHNSYLYLLVEFGIIGLLIYLSIIMSILKEINLKNILITETSMMMILSITILALVSDTIYDPESWLLLGLILVLVHVEPHYSDTFDAKD